ncbi:L-lactate dehydrogenase [Paenibacillus aestuarii]|uniref:L-lactate dehydrogenase n=1 Tax=Paenibacillus aestuarii TaxID=516965 RepID=A0ABW0K5V7_9BACL|nr:L-lactate dehydrogenase [Paenibacillus aestuarii]
MKKSRIVVIGSGAVGATTAYTLMLRNRADELVLIDSNEKKAAGDALDMNHGIPFLGTTKLWAGTYADCQEADIIIITAGAAQREGEPRTELLKRNTVIMDNIMNEVMKHNSSGIILLASNPVDVMSYYAWRKSGLPVSRVIGSGTLLDSARFRYLIGSHLSIDPRSVHAHIVGEHGDSELPVWSLANVAGTKLELSDEDKDHIFTNTRDAAYEIISAKGATYYAIALALDRICTAILRDEGAVLNVSTLLEDYHGISDVYLGVPCIVDRGGVREVLKLDLSDSEVELLNRSAAKLKALNASITIE